MQANDSMTGQTESIRKVIHDIRGSGLQLEVDVRLSADDGWDMVGDRDVWRLQQPVAGQVVQWVSKWVREYHHQQQQEWRKQWQW